MSTRGVAITVAVVVVVVAGTIGAGGVLIGQGSKKAKSKPSAKTTAPKAPPLKTMCTLSVDGTLAKEFSSGTTQISESYDLTTVAATKDGADPQGAYRGNVVKGTFEGTGTQSTLNTTSEYKGSVVKGSITFSLTDNGYGTLSGEGRMSLQCKVTSGTATNKYGTKPIKSSTTTVVIPVKVTVEGSSATVSAKGGYGSLMGTFRAAGQ